MAWLKDFAALEARRLDSLVDFLRWYFHPAKFWLDQGAHVAVGLVAVAPVALYCAIPVWAGAATAALGALPRERDQWPPRRMPVLGRAWFDPVLDVAFFAAGGALAASVSGGLP